MNATQDTPLVDGFNPRDPGVAMLARAIDPARPALLVHCGPLPGAGPNATRLVLDVRERPENGERCIPAQLPADLRAASAPPDTDAVDPALPLGRRWPLALVWPRAHLGKDFSEQCLALAAMHLEPGGRLLCAVRKARGGASLKRSMAALLGNVRVAARDHGYHLHISENVAGVDLQLARAACERRYAWSDPLLGELELLGVPGVFSRKHLDLGTAALLRHLTENGTNGGPAPSRVLDIGCGVGPLSIWAARRWPAASVLAVETNALAAALARVNAVRAGLSERVRVLHRDILTMTPPATQLEEVPPGFLTAGCDLAVVNPPTHAPSELFARLVTAPASFLRPGAPAWFVVNRSGSLRKALRRSGAELDAPVEVPGFHLVRARWPASLHTR